MSVTLSSTTDTPEQVTAALEGAGYAKPSVATIASAGTPEANSAGTAEPSGPADAEDAAEAGETAADSETAEDSPEPEETEEETPKKKNRGLSKRFAELTRERKEAEARAAAAERKLAELRAAPRQPASTEPAPAAPSGAPPATKPTVEQFENYEEFVEALTDWKAEQREQARERAEAERERERENERAKSAWDAKQEAAREKYADYDDAVNQDLAITPVMQHVILRSEQGADLAYYLGSHPEECQRLASLDDVQAARELGRLEARLAPASSPSVPTTKTPTRSSSAPAPIRPVAAASPASGAPAAKGFETMTLREYEEWRRRRGGR